MNTVIMNKKKHIALIAHDERKEDMISWVKKNKAILSDHALYGTGTTAKRINEATALSVQGFESGPLGGDQQIGASIVEGNIDMMIFFWDPLSAHPHDPDVKALLRIAVLYNIPTATNIATADFLLTSPLLQDEYPRDLFNYKIRLGRP